ncbi:probable G-protein coupled receptor 25 [Xenopus laevis]|uniref:G-protein coupled receptors family 1 profile domain-containing protein n=2 Tax=Xenopus laevis TaxID=8355 RepID=A0A974DRT5_XENLA|nr:probable G-protein coupled receptor 25 [Xenopus laevis]OCT96385.1 hypothetical protein XELAEV_18014062mg [Xenopus laevis]
MADVTPFYDEYALYDNDTEPFCQNENLPHGQWILPALYLFFFFFGLTGNAVVIAIVSKRSSRRADIFILNLAISDLFFVLTLPFWASSLALGGQWPFGIHLCRASGFIIAVTRCASSLLMAIMSVDRYLAVIGGHRIHPFRTRTCSMGACCIIWFISLVSGIPPLMFRHLEQMVCVESSESVLSTGIKLATLFLTFVLPLTVVLFCYSCMAKHLWNYFGGHQNVATSKLKPRRRHSWLRIVSCVVAAYSLSWLPYNTLSAVTLVDQLGEGLSCHTLVVINQALSATAAIAFANSCTNPLIYSILDAGFRHRTKQALPRIFPMCTAVFNLSFPGWSQQSTVASTESSSSYTLNTSKAVANANKKEGSNTTEITTWHMPNTPASL